MLICFNPFLKALFMFVNLTKESSPSDRFESSLNYVSFYLFFSFFNFLCVFNESRLQFFLELDSLNENRTTLWPPFLSDLVSPLEESLQ